MNKNIILIPYRKRKEHLKYFIENTVPKLIEKVNNLEILIVKQCNGKKFNRGKLMNVGYKYYDNSNNFYITQDVDINPIHNSSLIQYNRNVGNSILRIFSSKFDTLGGIVKFKGSSFEKINGFTNNYWGWGLEDRNLRNRARHYGINILTYMLDKCKTRNLYFKEFDDVKDRTPLNNKQLRRLNYKLFNLMSKEKRLKYIYESGLNNLEYKILKEKKINDYIKKITVKI